MTDDYLTKLVTKYIEEETSDEYQKMDRRVKEQANLFNTVKEHLKKQGKTRVTVVIGKTKHVLDFKVKKSFRVDPKLIPVDEKEKYHVATETWVKQLVSEEMEE